MLIRILIALSIFLFLFVFPAQAQNASLEKGNMLISANISFPDINEFFLNNNKQLNRADPVEFQLSCQYLPFKHFFFGFLIAYRYAPHEFNFRHGEIQVGPELGFLLGTKSSRIRPFIKMGIAYIHKSRFERENRWYPRCAENYSIIGGGSNMSLSAGTYIRIYNRLFLNFGLAYDYIILKYDISNKEPFIGYCEDPSYIFRDLEDYFTLNLGISWQIN